MAIKYKSNHLPKKSCEPQHIESIIYGLMGLKWSIRKMIDEVEDEPKRD